MAVFRPKFVDFLALLYDNNLDCLRLLLVDNVGNSSIDFVALGIQLMVVYHAVNMDNIRILALRMCTSIVDRADSDFDSHTF